MVTLVTTTSIVGKQIAIPAGAVVRSQGVAAKRARNTNVTVQSAEPARNGKIRVYWTSMGYKASTLIKV